MGRRGSIPANEDTEALADAAGAATRPRRLVAYPVDTLVNSVQNDGPELIEPLEGHEARS